MQVGKYQLVRKLATGGMAEVYLAKVAGPMGFEKEVVVKRVLPHLAEDRGFVEMFFTEARLAARLNHPHIVQIFDFGQADGTYYLAMEYIDGLNLRALMKRVNSLKMALSPVLCAKLIAMACEGLAFAHALREPETGQPLELIHRDVSLDNILLSREGGLKIVDFGIAKAANQSHRTLTGVIKGKLSYMAPEQIRAMPLDLRVDVYSLGVVFYELLTGRKPFNATTEASMAQAILFEPPVPVLQRRPDLPQAVARILDRALAKDRDQRYADCRAFLSDLEDYLLSTGKKVGVHRTANFVSKMLEVKVEEPPAPPSEPPRATPPPPPSETETLPPAPRVTPPPAPREVLVPIPRRMSPPPRPGLAITKVESAGKLGVSTAPKPRPAPRPTQSVDSEAETLPARAVFRPHQKTGLAWALACVGLLLAGGGLLAWRLGGEPQPIQPASPPAAQLKSK
ncbi:serine/threonine protein kinase [Hyalangium gracile]|uniref:serine/threonine protein kinase n=1 Tax=Hyalangium gracile TaxID=394092 RepID=UPI001CC9BA84